MTANAKDVSAADFEREVIARSAQVPVVVDFWAPWCGPCRVLGPVLEAEIGALGGRVEMVKVNTDENQSLAMDFGVQGIPAVKAFRNGEMVAEFVGAHPAPFVKGWLAQLAPSASAEALDLAELAAKEGRNDEAEALLSKLVDEPETRDKAALRLARLLAAIGRGDEVPAILAKIDPRSETALAIPSIERLVAFGTDARAYGGEEAARAALAKDGKDPEARFALGSALAARGAFEEALGEFLEIVARNRKFKEDGARLAILALFEHLGSDHPLTGEYRRRLQVVL